MYHRLRKLLFCLPPELAHDIALNGLKYLNAAHMLPRQKIDDPVELFGLKFPNRIGLAAGLDKQARYANALAKLGFGHIEVGTVTPKPQTGNSKPRVFRLPKAEALINRFGFNSVGLDQFVANVKRLKFEGVLGINIGKNKVTPNENAVDDYLLGLRTVYQYADYVTVNISSPNTEGLRELQHGRYFNDMLAQLKRAQHELANTHNRWVPLLLKVAPDLTSHDIKVMSELLLAHKVEGLIATNTTVGRSHVANLPHAKEAGGLSGKPLAKKSTAVLSEFYQNLSDKVVLIGAGGVCDAQTASDKFAAGAQLVQVYTGFIYHGPALLHDIGRVRT